MGHDKVRPEIQPQVYGITQTKSAELIAAVTERPCSTRTVRSWVNASRCTQFKPMPGLGCCSSRKGH